MVIVVALPFILQGYWGVDLSNPPGEPATTLPPAQLLLMVFAGIAGWQIAKAVGLFGASILGPMILAGALSLLGILQHRPPAIAGADLAFVIAHHVLRIVTVIIGAPIAAKVFNRQPRG